MNAIELTQRRKQCGLTCAQLAKQLGYKSRSTIINWERGYRRIPVWLPVWFIGYYKRRKGRNPWSTKVGKRIPNETRLKILRDYVNGEKIAVISAVHSVHERHVKILAKRYGIPVRKNGRPPKKHNSQPQHSVSSVP